MTISTGAMWTYAFTAPDLAREIPALLTDPTSGIVRAVIASMFIGQIGWLLMGLVALRANVIPRWAAVVAIGSILLAMALTPFAETQFIRFVFNLLLGAGPLAVGWVLWRGPGGTDE